MTYAENTAISSCLICGPRLFEDINLANGMIKVYYIRS